MHRSFHDSVTTEKGPGRCRSYVPDGRGNRKVYVSANYCHDTGQGAEWRGDVFARPKGCGMVLRWLHGAEFARRSGWASAYGENRIVEEVGKCAKFNP